MDASTVRPLTEARRGYTSFSEGDVLFAKITPCMENGKTAVARGLASGIGFGSTEFHVLRARPVLDPQLLYYFLAQESVRRDARRHMTGSAGQLRVPAAYFQDVSIPIAPLQEQRRIVAAIEEQFTRLDAGVAALKRVRANLKRYRAAVLKAAVEGKLTEAWRAEHPEAEPASALLERILAERRRRWEATELAKYEETGKTPLKGWQAKYKEPVAPDTSGLTELPEGWAWVSVEQLLDEPMCNGVSVKGTDAPPGVPALRLSAMSYKGFDYNDRRYIPVGDAVATSLAIQEGDFFVSRGNGSLHLVGRGVLAQKPGEIVVFPDTMIRLRFAEVMHLRQFIAVIWGTRLVRGHIEKKARTTAGIYKISQGDIAGFALPLPPLFEQEQIVAEIERRLSVIETVEAQVDAGLKRAARLRQSILKRAFEGKLVPQDPSDEPASLLLERIQTHREHEERGSQVPLFGDAGPLLRSARGRRDSG